MTGRRNQRTNAPSGATLPELRLRAARALQAAGVHPSEEAGLTRLEELRERAVSTERARQSHRR